MQITSETFAFPFQDEEWLGKFAVAMLLGVLSFLLIPLLPLYGMGVRVMRGSIRGEPLRFPEWNDWGGLIKDGFRFWLVSFAYALPMFVMYLCGSGFMFVTILAPALALGGTSGTPSQDLMTLVSVGAPIMSIVVMFGAFFIGSILAIPLSFFANVALTRAIAHNSLRYAFDLNGVWRLIRLNPMDFVVAMALSYAVLYAGSIAVTLISYTIILTCFVPFLYGILYVYYTMIMGALFGRAYREAQDKLATVGEIA